MAPFEALYSLPPPTVASYFPGSTVVHAVDTSLRSRDRTLQILKMHLQAAQARMKSYADARRTERSFEINDLVYLRLQPYRQTTTANQAYSKLFPRFYGPFRVEEKIGLVSYKLRMPPTSRMHPVFHVSALKLKLGAHDTVESHLPTTLDQFEWEPEKILDRGMFKQRNVAVTRWLIKWKNRSVEEATWEDA
ncbi:uncharacterized protein LOC113290596 [Papaver somniferum]|uniref:uncharacterized protein LOC113290596 n=1 Tax=Papaver somniferum TaxID=3469 RepID=UPI000E6F76F9|nr:uncharacterized protein LOC113290596 [Papaver somniferum]